MPSQLSFNEELNVIKTNLAFRGYATSYKVDIIEKKGPIKQLETSKSSIKDLVSDLLNETKGFKYQITLTAISKNTNPMHKLNLCQFISIQKKTVINHKLVSKMFFKKILYRIDNWINEGSGWSIELIESQYINVSTYRPLSGSSYVKLPSKLSSLKKD